MKIEAQANRIATRSNQLLIGEAGQLCCLHCCVAGLRGMEDWCCFASDSVASLSLTNIRSTDGSAIPCGLDADQSHSLPFNRRLAVDFSSASTHELDLGWGDALTQVIYAWISGGGGTSGFPAYAQNLLNLLITTPEGVQIRSEIPLRDCCGGSAAGTSVSLYSTGSSCADLPVGGLAVLADVEIQIGGGCCKGDTRLSCIGTPGDCDCTCDALP